MHPSFYSKTWSMLREVTIRVLESIPPDQMGYKPPNSHTVAEIVRHIASAEYRFTNAMTGSTEAPPKIDAETRDELVAVLRAGQKRSTAILDGLSSEDVARIIPTPMGTDGPAEVWLTIMLVHESDHKGNLTAMAKTLGAHPPDIAEVRKQMAAAPN